MARKKKDPPVPPSKAYLVSFGDTMTALLAFFIVLNSFANEQTGANLYTGTGSFINAVKSSGLPGQYPGNRTSMLSQKSAPAPIYAFDDPDEQKDSQKQLGPDENPDKERIVDLQTDNFKRFLSQLNQDHAVVEKPPTKSEIVFDSFEQFNRPSEKEPYFPLKEHGIEIASEAIMKLFDEDYEVEVVVWATMPAEIAMNRALDKAMAIQTQIDASFLMSESQRGRLIFSGKPWLFSDAKRPKVSFVISKLDTE